MMHTMVTNARKINFPALTTLKITQLLHHNIEWVSTLPLGQPSEIEFSYCVPVESCNDCPWNTARACDSIFTRQR